MAITTRFYLSGVCVAAVLCATAATFPNVPAILMLGTLGGAFLALASRTHRHAQAHPGNDGRIGGPSACRQPQQVSPPDQSFRNTVRSGGDVFLSFERRSTHERILGKDKLVISD